MIFVKNTQIFSKIKQISLSFDLNLSQIIFTVYIPINLREIHLTRISFKKKQQQQKSFQD